MTQSRVVVCDDEMLIRLWLVEHLHDAGYEVEAVEDGASLLELLQKSPADVVVLDLRLPDGSGIDLLPRLLALDSELPVIMLTAYGEIETAVAAVRAGAHHFLEKPVEFPALHLLIEQALETRRLRTEVERLRESHRWQFADVSLVGRSPAIRRTAELIERVAARGSPVNVLIRGESGTGKDVVARALHARGPRRSHPFITVNCTALPEHLVESELFGHEAGAYTDARGQKRGLLEVAHKGTVFLDEIGDIPKAMQAKLLHFLETHDIRRVGGVRTVEVDVHVVTATNRDLEEAVARGEFREDLFYRLNVVPIQLPPLRERPEDIAPLATYFIETLSRDLDQAARLLTTGAKQALEAYEWPGNARELRNVLERILLLEEAREIRLEHLPPPIRGARPEKEHAFMLPAAGLDLEVVERDLIFQALERTEWNKTSAARLLGLTRDTLRYRLEKYGVHDRRTPEHGSRTAP